MTFNNSTAFDDSYFGFISTVITVSGLNPFSDLHPRSYCMDRQGSRKSPYQEGLSLVGYTSSFIRLKNTTLIMILIKLSIGETVRQTDMYLNIQIDTGPDKKKNIHHNRLTDNPTDRQVHEETHRYCGQPTKMGQIDKHTQGGKRN